MNMHIAVIGAGAAGLCATRHLTAPNSGFTCVVFEQTDSVGGTWVYTENTGTDKYGLAVCSSMYKSLRTNLGKENMEFPGFPFLNSKSFVRAAEVNQYLEDYANHYDLKKHVKFLHHVKHISPSGEKWHVTTTYLPNSKETTEEFDAVFVCNGHHTEPYMGSFPGVTDFKGEILHSHCYRTPEPFTNKTVLISGAGPSGIDISADLARCATKVYFSHNSAIVKSNEFPKNVEHVPVVKIVKKDHVIFEDGAKSDCIDVIITATGYKYSFPFLAPECGITVVEGKYIQPLYKHIVNINQPTMFFIGILFRTLILPLFDYQVRFSVKTLTGEVVLPNKEDMLTELAQEICNKQEQGVPLRKYHEMSKDMRCYMKNLAEFANLKQYPPVIYNIYDFTSRLRKTHLKYYRNAVFEIIDDTNFKVTGLEIENLNEVQGLKLSS